MNKLNILNILNNYIVYDIKIINNNKITLKGEKNKVLNLTLYFHNNLCDFIIFDDYIFKIIINYINNYKIYQYDFYYIIENYKISLNDIYKLLIKITK